MSLRQALWILVLLLLVLAGWQFLRAVWLSRDPMSPSEATAASATAPGQPVMTAAAGEEDGGEGFDYAPRLNAATADAAVGNEPEAFRSTLETQRLRRLLDGQQALVDQQRAEIETLQAEVAGLRQQLEESLHAQPPQSMASPEYAEATRLAEQGLDAEEIAARCGISIAEAGLLVSLARSGGHR
ncbi:DUF2802 domain-containing protein [Thauera sp. Sel9]|uniref:DUF2802 domain-containing protein n=1 Tax=Thauera sp. Sel9 TaxID=2974299 RepID=UPI0021E1488C|nr:DUF2802 domain-containing protein [Thauera sp. Sel9]MCV2218758.1 DUF2802 domain-containing protein [Thauera sp. Sel9]